MAEMPTRLDAATARFPLARWGIGLVLGLMAIRGATDEILGVAQWSGAIWGFTSSLPVWIFLGIGSLFLLTVDLWLPRLLRHSSGQTAVHAESQATATTGADRPTPTFVAVEAEIALAHEEAIEMTKMLRSEWPHITPDGAVVQTALPDWKDKTTDFIGAVLGSAHRAAFKGSGTGDNGLERLESEGEFLSNLALKLAPDSVRANESAVLEARRKRRDHQAASFLTYDHSRAAGAPAKPDDAIPSRELRHRARNAQHRGAALADLFKEGEDFRLNCTKIPEGDSAVQAHWHLVGGTPQEQCAREDQARQWDEKVSGFLWADPDLKQFGPGWRPAGEPIKKAPAHPDQSMMNPDRLAAWYQGKLDYLRGVIDKAGQ